MIELFRKQIIFKQEALIEHRPPPMLSLSSMKSSCQTWKGLVMNIKMVH